MSALLGCSLALMGGAALSAVALAGRPEERGYKPIAYVLCAIFGANLGRLAINRYLPTWEGHPAYVGWERVLFHMEQALLVADPVMTAAASWFLFTRRCPWPAVVVWAVVVLMLSISYPELRGAKLRDAYLALELASLFASIVALVRFISGGHHVGIEHVAMLLILVVQVVVLLLGPWSRYLFTRWDLAQWAYLALFGVLILVQGGALCLPRRS